MSYYNLKQSQFDDMPPWQKITVTTAMGSMLLNWIRDGWSKSSLLSSFAALWLLGFVLWAVWAVWVYPLLLSPLRNLPEPSGNHWMMGQWFRIVREPSGMPMREWFVFLFEGGGLLHLTN